MNTKDEILKILNEVTDPEVPVLSIIDLGIVRDVKLNKEEIEIMITPTYSGCPAMELIKTNIQKTLSERGYKSPTLTTVLSPAWTTDWMSERGKEKLKAFGIAPPTPRQHICKPDLFHEGEAIQCPLCNSYNTRMISRFGSTPCKALYQCNEVKNRSIISNAISCQICLVVTVPLM